MFSFVGYHDIDLERNTSFPASFMPSSLIYVDSLVFVTLALPFLFVLQVPHFGFPSGAILILDPLICCGSKPRKDDGLLVLPKENMSELFHLTKPQLVCPYW